MKWSADSSEGVRSTLARAISAQLTRAQEVLGVETNTASAVHETRLAIKRVRALLRLADPCPSDSRADDTLRDASRVLAVLRDADVLVLTTEDIRDRSPSSAGDVVPPHLLEALEEERGRRFAGSGSADGPLIEAGELLRSVALQEPPASDGTELLRLGLAASYASVRAQSDPAAGEGPVAERFHKLRKRVKDLRYQLEFLDTGPPKLGRLVRDLHHLTDLLGDANDLAMLSACTASTEILSEIERAALIAHVDGVKQALRSEAAALSDRLFEEDPDSFVQRIEAWVAPPQG